MSPPLPPKNYKISSAFSYNFISALTIANASTEEAKDQRPQIEVMPKWKEYCTYIAVIFSVVGMMLMDKIGDAGYLAPGLATAFLLVIGAIDFKEVRNNIASPLILMMAGVIGANLFNLVLVSGSSISLSPFTIPQGSSIAGMNASLVMDIPVMFAVMLLLTVPALKKGKLYRVQGILLLAIYTAFCAVQFTM